MADLNKVILIGRLTRDPELRQTQSQMSICNFGFAVGRKYKTASGEQREETCFLDCTCFGKGAEIFAQYMAKGSQCCLEGRLKLDQWDDKTTGQKRSKLHVIVENFQFLGTPNGERRQQREDADPPHGDAGSEPQAFNDDDIPF